MTREDRVALLYDMKIRVPGMEGLSKPADMSGIVEVRSPEEFIGALQTPENSRLVLSGDVFAKSGVTRVESILVSKLSTGGEPDRGLDTIGLESTSQIYPARYRNVDTGTSFSKNVAGISTDNVITIGTFESHDDPDDPEDESARMRYSIAHRSGASNLGSGLSFVDAPNADAVASGAFSNSDTPNLMVARLGDAILQGPGIFDDSNLPSSFDDARKLVWVETNWASMKKDLGIDMRSANGGPPNEWGNGDGLLVIYMNGKTLDYTTPSRSASWTISGISPWLGGFMQATADKRLDFFSSGKIGGTDFSVKSTVVSPYQSVVSVCTSLLRAAWSAFMPSGTASQSRTFYKDTNVPEGMKDGDVKLMVFASPSLDSSDVGAGEAVCIPIVHVAPEENEKIPFISKFVASVPCNEKGVVISDTTVASYTRIVANYQGEAHIGYVPEVNRVSRESTAVVCIDVDGSKTSVTGDYGYEYQMVSTKPDDWSSSYRDYYYTTSSVTEYTQNTSSTWSGSRIYYRKVLTEAGKNKFSWTFRKGMTVPRDHVDILLVDGFGEAYSGFCVIRIKFPRIAGTSQVYSQYMGVSVAPYGGSIATISNANYGGFLIRSDVTYGTRRTVTVTKNGSEWFNYTKFVPKFPKHVEFADLTLDDLKESGSLNRNMVLNFRDLVHDLTVHGGVEHIHFGAMSLSDFLEVAEYKYRQSSSSASENDVAASYLNGAAKGTWLEFFAPRGAIEVDSVDASRETPWGLATARNEALSQPSMDNVEDRFMSDGTFEYDPSNEYVNPCGWSEYDLSNDFSNEVGTDIVVVPYKGYGHNTEQSVFKATDAGTYHIRLAVRDTRETKWPDGSDATKVFTWRIRPKTVSLPTSATYTYDGYTGHPASDHFQDYLDNAEHVPADLKTAVSNGVVVANLTLSDQEVDYAVEPGEYKVVFRGVNGNYVFGSGAATIVTRDLTVNKKKIPLPSFSSFYNDAVSLEYDLNGGSDIMQSVFDDISNKTYLRSQWGNDLFDRIDDPSNEFHGGSVKVFTNNDDTPPYKFLYVECTYNSGQIQGWSVDEDIYAPINNRKIRFQTLNNNIVFTNGSTNYEKTLEITPAKLPMIEGGFTIEYDPSNESMLAEVMNTVASSISVQSSSSKYYGAWSLQGTNYPYTMRNSKGKLLVEADIKRYTTDGEIMNGQTDTQVFNNFKDDVSMTAYVCFISVNQYIAAFHDGSDTYSEFNRAITLSRHVMTLNASSSVGIRVDDTKSDTGYIIDAVLGNSSIFNGNDKHGRNTGWYRSNVIEASVQKYRSSNSTWEDTQDFGAGLNSKRVLVKTRSGGAYDGLYCFGGGNSNIVTQKAVSLNMYLINLPFPDNYSFPESGYTSSTRVELPYIKIPFTSSEGGSTHDYIDDVLTALKNWIDSHNIEGHEHWDRMLAYVNQNKLSITAAVNGVWTLSQGSTTAYTFTNGTPTEPYQKMQLACVYRVRISLSEVANSGAPLLWTVTSTANKTNYTNEYRDILVDLRAN